MKLSFLFFFKYVAGETGGKEGVGERYDMMELPTKFEVLSK